MATKEWQVRYLNEKEASEGQKMSQGSQEEMKSRFLDLRSDPGTRMVALYNEQGIRVDAYEHPNVQMPR